MFFWIIFQPENILLDNNFCVKLSDFGFATIVDGDEELTGKLKSHWYMYGVRVIGKYVSLFQRECVGWHTDQWFTS